ncbi:MAG: DUF898 family protein [Hyphomicrobium sp.]
MHDTTAHAAAAPKSIDIAFDNHGDRLIGLGLVNGLLKVVSLGLYSFWGKTEVRRRLWSFTRLNGEPLEYTGTGKELFLGFLVVFFAFVLPLMLGGLTVALLFPGQKGAIAIYQFAAYALFFFLLGNALYRAQRYRMSRTRWRGIRAGLEGSPAAYGWAYFWTLVLPFALVAALTGAVAFAGSPSAGGLIGTVGFVAALWALPWRSNKLQRMLTNDMRFGDRALSYSGSSKPLYKRYFFAWAGSALLYLAALAASAYYAYSTDIVTSLQLYIPPTGQQIAVFAALWIGVLIAAGLITAWYRASQMNHFARHTHLDSATFKLNASGKSLMWLFFSNWMLAALGIAGGLALGGFAAYAAGLLPAPPEPGMEPAEPGLLPIITIMVPVMLMTTLTTTFAQFRSARYFLSRLKLDGAVNLDAIMQSQHSGPKRGEGLAQVFDLDAF